MSGLPVAQIATTLPTYAVNAIAPTVVWTPLVERFADEAPDPAAMREAMQNYNPVPGIPTAEDVAAAVAFLASDEARWITGHTLPVDGGYTIAG